MGPEQVIAISLNLLQWSASPFTYLKISDPGASLVMQWLRIRLLMQGTRVRALLWEDPTCRGATKPHVPQLLSLCSRACEPQLLSPHATTTEPTCHNY